jgi:hypothetical protein
LCHGLDQPADAGQLQQLWRAALDSPVASAHVVALAAQACRHGEVLAGL